MNRSSTSSGLAIALVAALTFGASGALIKPLFDAGWSPASAAAARVLVGGLILLPFALLALRGKWNVLWRARRRVIAMAGVGVAGTQLVYFAAFERIPVGTAILIQYMAPLLLVGIAWARTRRMPKVVVLVGSAAALAGLTLVVSPGGGGGLDPVGVAFAVAAMVGCAGYYLIAAQPSNGLPAIVLAAGGLLIGGVMLLVVGVLGIVPFETSLSPVMLFGNSVDWWVPIAIVGLVATAIAYASSITASEMLGSRLASFVGLLEVVAATFYAWLLLGEQLGVPQLIGGVLILAGIGFVRSAKDVELLVAEISTGSISVISTSSISGEASISGEGSGGGEVVGVEDGVAVPLLGEEPLPVLGEVLVDGVAGDEGIEVGWEAALFRAQQPTEPLRLLLPGAERAGDLDRDRRLGQVDAEVGDL